MLKEAPQGEVKRGVAGKVLGGIGVDLGILNTVNVEVVRNKLEKMGQELSQLGVPISRSVVGLEGSVRKD